MNARLQQLMDQSFTDHQGERFDPERFAELIVRECVGLVQPTSHHEAWAQSYLGGVDGLELLHSKATLIKKHFEVES
jgi:hypothetical protein